MIIDAMDILYSGNVEGFCIVSSDSDFTRLASRLRESGMYVVGMGERKTPTPFITACNKFKYLEVLAKSLVFNGNEQEGSADVNTNGSTPLDAVVTPREIVQEAILSIVDETSDDDGWSPLSDIGNTLIKRFPDFDVRNYGFVKLTPFISSLNCFDVKSVRRNNLNINLIYIKRKESKS